MSNPFILIARIRVKEGKVEEYLKIAKEADDAVKASEPDMLIHTFDQDPTAVSYTHLTLPTILRV